MTDLIERTRAWIAADPDPTTRAQLEALIDGGHLDELGERMNGSLVFGTAGLRAAVEAGSNRMNRAVVIRTTRGIGDYLIDRYGGVPSRPVVIGKDARLSSPQFMEDAIGVLTAAGFEVRFWEGETPTPVVAYGATALGACAAIVITASHNPAADNGYKVYDANGAQIVPPVDSLIAAAIDRVGPANEVPMMTGEQASNSRPIERATYDDYQADIARLRVSGGGEGNLRIVYTPMHGVGWQSVRAALRAAGYEDLHPVPEQVEPDGHFPTAPFPNPEEPGALDLATGLADRLGADIVLANDPDADRLAVALPSESGWANLTGNQIGVLLADYVLAHHTGTRVPLVINSIVSSPMLADIAAAYSARFETTLTGFKWIANAAMDIEQAGEAEFVFGYEEALGYTVGPVVRDKDGVSAALVFADLAAECRRQGVTVRDKLADLYRRFGLWTSTQMSLVRPGSAGQAEIEAAMERLRHDHPKTLGGARVVAVTDYRDGAENRPRWLPASALVVFDMDDGGRILVRPSGTEPKLKIYVDGRAAVPKGHDLVDLEAALFRAGEQAASDLASFLGLGDRPVAASENHDKSEDAQP